MFSRVLLNKNSYSSLIVKSKSVNNAFHSAFRQNKLYLAKWLIKSKPQINSKILFYDACKTGNLKLCIFLCQLNNNIQDFSLNNNGAFNIACTNGHINVCKYLYSINPSIIQVTYDTHYYQRINERGHIHIINWLNSIGH